MSKFKYKTLPKHPREPVKAQSIPRKKKNKSETKLKDNDLEEGKLVFNSK